MTDDNDQVAPDLYELLLLTRDADLVGEEETVLTLILSMIRGGLVIMTGLSRGGKDHTVNAAEYCFPDDRVHDWPSSTSPTAPFEKADELNKKPVHRFPDLASLDKHIEIILKAFGEGEPATHEYTDVNKRGGDEPALSGATLYPPRTQIAFIASDNQDLNLDDYPELRNRGLVVSVDASEELTKKVTERQAKRRAGLIERNIAPVRTAQIRQYLGNIPVDEYETNKNRVIRNPASMAIQAQEPIPTKFTEARQDFDRLMEMMETVALYHHEDRMTVQDGSQKKMLVTPQDCWYAMQIFGKQMIMSTLNIRKEDRAILEYLRDDATRSYEVKTIQQDLREEGYNISDTQVRQSLEQMREKGYVQRNDSQPVTYQASAFANHVRYDAGLDWDAVVEGARDKVYDILPEDEADDYVARYLTDEALTLTHPFTGEEVDIRETDMNEELAEEHDEMEAVMDEPVYGGPSDDEGTDDGVDTTGLDDLGMLDSQEEGQEGEEQEEAAGEATQGTLS